jgi:plasmid stability protein
MPQLIVSQIEEKVVKKLKQQGGAHGVSMEEEHRRILRESLPGRTRKRISMKRYLYQTPDLGPDDLLERNRLLGREVDL